MRRDLRAQQTDVILRWCVRGLPLQCDLRTQQIMRFFAAASWLAGDAFSPGRRSGRALIWWCRRGHNLRRGRCHLRKGVGQRNEPRAPDDILAAAGMSNRGHMHMAGGGFSTPRRNFGMQSFDDLRRATTAVRGDWLISVLVVAAATWRRRPRPSRSAQECAAPCTP